MPERAVDMLLVEPVTLLRRTVSLTARSLGLGAVHEAANQASALKLLYGQRFHGAVIALGEGTAPPTDPDAPERTATPGQLVYPELEMIDAVRGGLTACQRDMPIAVMLERATPELVAALSERDVGRIILKPFRARDLLDAFAAFAASRRGS